MNPETVVNPMSTILGNITLLVEEAFDWAGTAVTFITANPLVELFVITSFVGLGVGLVTRLLRG